MALQAGCLPCKAATQLLTSSAIAAILPDALQAQVQRSMAQQECGWQANEPWGAGEHAWHDLLESPLLAGAPRSLYQAADQSCWAMIAPLQDAGGASLLLHRAMTVPVALDCTGAFVPQCSAPLRRTCALSSVPAAMGASAHCDLPESRHLPVLQMPTLVQGSGWPTMPQTSPPLQAIPISN